MTFQKLMKMSTFVGGHFFKDNISMIWHFQIIYFGEKIDRAELRTNLISIRYVLRPKIGFKGSRKEKLDENC